MSLVSQLQTKTSPVSQWMDAHVDSTVIRALAKEVNGKLATRTPIRVEGSDPTLVGTAFDYAFRWLLGPLVARNLVAMHGAMRGPSEKWVIVMPGVVDRIVREGNSTVDPRRRAQSAVILAWFEQCFRSMLHIPSVLAALDLTSAQVDTGPTLEKLYAQTPQQSVDDIMQLLDTVPGVWGEDLKQPFILNPTFDGSRDVGGADADWIMSGVLYDCKCSGQPRPFGRETALQILGYVLLDYSGRYPIDSVGWYFARHQMRIAYPLVDILDRVFGSHDLGTLRESFAAKMRASTRTNGIS